MKEGFTLFGPAHIAWLVISLAAAVAAYALGKSTRRTMLTARWLGIVTIALDWIETAYRLCWMCCLSISVRSRAISC